VDAVVVATSLVVDVEALSLPDEHAETSSRSEATAPTSTTGGRHLADRVLIGTPSPTDL